MPVSPYQAARDVMDRADALLALDTDVQPTSVRADLRRMAVAMGVASLDTYLHWAIRRVNLDTMSNALAKTPIDFGQMIASGRKSIESRKRDVADRPLTRARNVLNAYLLGQTFQSAEQVQKGLSLAGVSSAFPQLAAAMIPATTPNELKKRLNDLSHRRNKIVHEGDLVRRIKPSVLAHERITRKQSDEDIAWLRSFIEALKIVLP